jgi:asparagine N-glycosylation enzyme membrane subunit Stt3
MIRSIIAIVVSFITVNLLIMALFLVTAVVLGIEGTLRPGEYWTSTTFNVIVLAGGAVMSALGGVVCALIAKSWRPALVVVGVILALGLVGAAQNLQKPDPPTRGDAVEGETDRQYATRILEEMMEVGKEPTWFSFATPFVGALAFLGGARMVGDRRRRAISP